MCSTCYDISVNTNNVNTYNVNTYNVVDCYYTFMMNIKVSNGPLSNGNTHAELEIYYKSTDYDAVDKVYYIEHGSNPIRKYIGSHVIWDNENHTRFSVF